MVYSGVMGKLVIYTDGSYRPSKKQMGIGIVYIYNDNVIKEYSDTIKGGTNNIAELTAIYRALKSIKKNIEELEIVSDSEYSIQCITNETWNPKSNVELINKIKDQLKETQKLVSKPIEFRHTFGHMSDKWNNKADKLATTASNYLI